MGDIADQTMAQFDRVTQGKERRDWLLNLTGEEHRDELLSKDAYISPEFFRLEQERLWPRIWQVACREEEIPNVGDFVEYEIIDDSIIVVRVTPDKIKAYHNVCMHRGRKLVQGTGNVKQFRCGYHAWRYSLEGACTEIVDGDDYVSLCKEDVSLKEVKLDIWSGYVFINMDPNAEPLLDYLAPVPEFLDPYDIGKMRFRWYKSVVMPSNWKTAMDPFIETYHVQSAHPQVLPFYDDASLTIRRGKHSQVTVPPDCLGFGLRSPRLNSLGKQDPRALIKRFFELMEVEVRTVWTSRDVEAVQGLMDLPEDISPGEVYVHYFETLKKLAAQDGSGERKLTLEHLMISGIDWHIFPNHFTLPTADGALAYRVRPNGREVESCILDVWALMRYAPGEEPPLKREFYTDWREGDFPNLFTQDFVNIPEVQKGMRSRGLDVLRPNPVQESSVANYHSVIRKYLFG